MRGGFTANPIAHRNLTLSAPALSIAPSLRAAAGVSFFATAQLSVPARRQRTPFRDAKFEDSFSIFRERARSSPRPALR